MHPHQHLHQQLELHQHQQVHQHPQIWQLLHPHPQLHSHPYPLPHPRPHILSNTHSWLDADQRTITFLHGQFLHTHPSPANSRTRTHGPTHILPSEHLPAHRICHLCTDGGTHRTRQGVRLPCDPSTGPSGGCRCMTWSSTTSRPRSPPRAHPQLPAARAHQLLSLVHARTQYQRGGGPLGSDILRVSRSFSPCQSV